MKHKGRQEPGPEPAPESILLEGLWCKLQTQKPLQNIPREELLPQSEGNSQAGQVLVQNYGPEPSNNILHA